MKCATQPKKIVVQKLITKYIYDEEDLQSCVTYNL